MKKKKKPCKNYLNLQLIIGMNFGIERSIKLMMKKSKKETNVRRELPNTESIITLGEKEVIK